VNAEQVARNDALFRDANERIHDAAIEYDVDPVPFICECAEPTCHEVIALTLAEYDRVRATPTRFVIAPGHEGVAPHAVEVVERTQVYFVVEKVGRAAEVAAELDPRSA